MTKFYDHISYPQQGSAGSSEALRAELQKIEAGFDLVENNKADQTDLAALEARVTSLETFGTGGGGGGGDGSSQPLSVLLTSIANLSVSANDMIYATSDSAFATTTLSAFARAVLDDPDANTMRSTLGLTIGSTVQPYSGLLNSLANASGVVSNTMPYFTGASTVAVTPITAFARTLLDDADAATMKATLGITDSLSANAALNAIANTTPAADRVPYFNGTTTATLATLTAFGRSLIGTDNNATARAILGLGTMATQNTSGWATEAYVSSLLGSYVATSSLSSTLSNYVTFSGLSSTLSGYALSSHNHTGVYATASHTHSQYAANGSNSDITGLTGLNSIQTWPNVDGLHIAYGNTTATSKYVGVTNLNHTTGISYLFARNQKDTNSGYWESSLRQDRTGISYLQTTGSRINIQTYVSGVLRTPFRVTDDVAEFPENASTAVGGLARFYGSGTSSASRYDMYPTKSATPDFRINNDNGVGVQIAWNSNTWTTLSDIRTKNRVAEIEKPLNTMAKIKPFIGTYKHDSEGRLRPFYSAQDVWSAGWDCAVYKAQDDDETLSMSYTDMVPLIHAGVNELSVIQSELQIELVALKKEVMALKSQVALLS